MAPRLDGRARDGDMSSGAVFKGLAISNGASGPRLYATDFAQGAGHSRVDVFDGSWNPVNTPGAFVDPRLPKHYGPFGIQTIGDRVFVTYGKQQRGSDDEAHGRGLGIVDAYNLDGKFLRRVAAARAAQRTVGARLGAEVVRPLRRRPAGRQLR